jgi:hypothetical protein
MITIGTTRGAPHFTTGTITTEEEATAAELAATAVDLLASVAVLAPVQMQGIGRSMGTPVGAVESLTVLALRLTHSVATTRLLEDTPNPAVNPGLTPAPSAATTMADKPGPIRHAAAQAWAAVDSRVAADLAAAVADTGSQTSVVTRAASEP